MTPHKKRVVLSAAVIVAAIAVYGSWLALGGPPSAPPRRMETLEAAMLPGFQARFDAASDSTRLLVLLSPTCVTCVRGASALQGLLEEMPSKRVKVLAVWEPVLDTDHGPPSPTVLSKLKDKRVEQYWDPMRLLSGRILTAARDRVPAFAIFSYEEHAAWDLAAVYPPGAVWEGDLPAPVYCGNPVVGALDSLRARLVE